MQVRGLRSLPFSTGAEAVATDWLRCDRILEQGAATGSPVRQSIIRIIAAAAIGVVLLAAFAAASVPTLRHIASGWWDSPDGLAALSENPEVHYDSG
jgi:hypothetical protein